MSRSSLLWILLVLLLTPVALGGAIVLRAHRLLADPEMLAGAFSLGLGDNVEFDAIEVAFWPPAIVIRGITIADRSVYGPGQLGHIDAVSLRAAVRPLLFGEVLFDDILIEKPTLRIVQGEEGWNLGPLAAGFSLPPAFAVLQIEAEGARLSYRDRSRPGGAELDLREATLRAGRGNPDDPWAGTVNGISPAEAGDGRIILNFEVPAQAADDYRVRVDLSRLAGASFDELLQLVGGEMPFGSRTLGQISGSVRALFPRTGDSLRAQVEADLDYTAAEVRMAGGWTIKQEGVPLSLGLGLEMRGLQGLRLLRFDAESGEASLRGLPGSGADESLVIVSQGWNGRLLERFVPALAALRPRGALRLAGGLEREDDRRATMSLRAGAERLSLLPDENRWEVGGFAIELGLGATGDLEAAFDAFDLEAPAVGFGHVRGSYVAREGAPSRFSLAAGGGGRSGAEIEQVALQGRVGVRGGVIDELSAEGLGGRIDGAAEVVSMADGQWAIDWNLRWEALQLESVASTLGWSGKPRGLLSGRAVARTVGRDGASWFEAAEGPLELAVSRARLGDDAPFATAIGALANLSGPRADASDDAARLARLRERLGDQAVLDEVSAVGVLAGGVFEVSRLVANNHAWSFEGAGTVASDGALDLDGKLTPSPFALGVLQDELPLVAGLMSGEAGGEVPLELSGAISGVRAEVDVDFLQQAAARVVRERRVAPRDLIRGLLDGNLPGS